MKEWCAKHKRFLVNALNVCSGLGLAGLLMTSALHYTGNGAHGLYQFRFLFVIFIVGCALFRFWLERKELIEQSPPAPRPIQIGLIVVCIVIFAGVFLILLGYLSQWIHGT